jgi:hypothetical protein
MSGDLTSPEREFTRGDTRWRVAWQALEVRFDIEVRPAVIPKWDESMRFSRTSYDPEPFEAGDLEDNYWQECPALIRTVEELDSFIDGGLPGDVRVQLVADVAAHAADETAWKAGADSDQVREPLTQEPHQLASRQLAAVLTTAPATAGTSAHQAPSASTIAEAVRRQSARMFPTSAREAMRDARSARSDACTVETSRTAAAPDLSAKQIEALSDPQNSPEARSDRAR